LIYFIPGPTEKNTDFSRIASGPSHGLVYCRFIFHRLGNADHDSQGPQHACT